RGSVHRDALSADGSLVDGKNKNVLPGQELERPLEFKAQRLKLRTNLLNGHLVQWLDGYTRILFAKLHKRHTTTRLQRVLNVSHHRDRLAQFLVHIDPQN